MIFAIYLDFGSSPFYGDSSINLFSCSDWKSVCELWLKALINLFTFSFVLLLGGLLILLTSFILLSSVVAPITSGGHHKPQGDS